MASNVPERNLTLPYICTLPYLGLSWRAWHTLGELHSAGILLELSTSPHRSSSSPQRHPSDAPYCSEESSGIRHWRKEVSDIVDLSKSKPYHRPLGLSHIQYKMIPSAGTSHRRLVLFFC